MNAANLSSTLPVRASGLALRPPPGSQARLPDLDAVELSAPLPRASHEEPEKKTSPWERVAQGAGLLCGLAGAGLAAPAMAQAQAVPAQTVVLPSPPGGGNGGIHVTAHIDATESIIAPIASDEVNLYERIKSAGGDAVTAEVAVVRNYNPGGKVAMAVACAALTIAPLAGARMLARRTNEGGFIKGSIIALGLAGSAYMGLSQGLLVDTLRNGVSAALDFTAQEPGWDGYRFYRVNPDQTQGFESELVDSKPQILENSRETATDFLAQNLSAHKDQLNVVVLTGHGLAYRHSAGFSFEDYQKMLQQAVEKSGRPIDLLVVESCLVGNTEFLAGTAPYARYALVSEDVVSAGALPTALAKAVGSGDARELTPEQLGQRILEASRGDRGISTLALVDLSKMSQLDQSVGQLGKALAQQVQSGDRQAVLKAIEGTELYPENEPLLGNQAKLLQYGDLSDFLSRLKTQFESSSNPQKGDVLRLISDTQASLDSLVVANRHDGTSHALSIQLPAGHFQKLEERLAERVGMSLFKNSHAPEGWKEFVGVTSEVLKATKQP